MVDSWTFKYEIMREKVAPQGPEWGVKRILGEEGGFRNKKKNEDSKKFILLFCNKNTKNFIKY